jgi:hypothetical protein
VKADKYISRIGSLPIRLVFYVSSTIERHGPVGVGCVGSILGLDRNPPWEWDWESGRKASFSVDLVGLGDTDDSLGEIDFLGLNRNLGFLRSLARCSNARFETVNGGLSEANWVLHIPRWGRVLNKQAGELRLGHH